MEADFGVELGAEDEALEFPWSDPEGRLRYYDLKRQPELLSQIEEAHRTPELGEFLAAINSPKSFLETAKCDAWTTPDISPEEEVFAAALKFGSYVDLLFREEERQFSFSDHEQLAERLTALLRRAPEIPAAAECLIRRCFYRHSGEVRDGFYITLYLFGYGNDEEHARASWVVALKLVENALQQIFIV